MKWSNSYTFVHIPVEETFVTFSAANSTICTMNSVLFLYVKDNTSAFLPFPIISSSPSSHKPAYFFFLKSVCSYNLTSFKITMFTSFLIQNLLIRVLYIQYSCPLYCLPFSSLNFLQSDFYSVSFTDKALTKVTGILFLFKLMEMIILSVYLIFFSKTCLQFTI